MLKVQRVESVSKENGKTYNNYYIYGTIDGVDVRAEVIPPDVGGYKLLEIVFKGETERDLKVIDREFKDANGKTVKSRAYAVTRTGLTEDGEFKEYVADVLPKRKSDRAMLAMLLG